jgi:hypothetical protein
MPMPQLLADASALFLERNAVYKDNYKNMGQLLLALFPDGRIPAIRNEKQANQLNLLIDCLGKLQRFAYNFENGGHADSARDLIVYAGMLMETTE